MSAYLVNEATINAIVNLSTQFGKESISIWDAHGVRHEYDATALGKELVAANLISVNTRYPKDKQDLPFNYKFKMDCYWSGRAVEVLKLCDCLEYQSSESVDWEMSRAKKLLEACRARVIRQLPGYSESAWSL